MFVKLALVEAREEMRERDPLCEEGVGDLAELEAAEDASGLEDAIRFGEDAVDVGAVADSERDGVEVDRVVGYCVELFGVAQRE